MVALGLGAALPARTLAQCLLLRPTSQSRRGGRTHLVLRLVDDALRHQQLRILLQHRLLLTDLLVHERLREHGLVHLVVAVAPVTHLGITRDASVRGHGMPASTSYRIRVLSLLHTLQLL